MPGRKGARNVGSNIREFHKGKTFARTLRKFGKKRADKQAVAVGFSEAGESASKSHKRTKNKERAKRRDRGNRGETEQ